MNEELTTYRSKIDLIDDAIAKALKERAILSAKIQKYKQENNIQRKDEGRQQQIIDRMIRATSGDVSADLIANIYRLIFTEAIK